MMKASVCMVTYNHAPFITQALDSVLMQETDFDYEIILGEDESNDGTREVCIDYANRYPDSIRLFLRSREDVIHINGRPTGRLNFVENLKAASGKYIALLEGDDYWTDPHKLQKQVEFLETNAEFSMCGHWIKDVGGNGEILDKQTFTGTNCPQIFSVEHALAGTPLHTNTWLVRRNIIEYILSDKEKMSLFSRLPAGDDPFLLMILTQGLGYSFPEYMGVYRIHLGGHWTTRSEVFKRFDMLSYYYSIPRIIGEEYASHAEKQIRSGEHRFMKAFASADGRTKRGIIERLIKSDLIPKKRISGLFYRYMKSSIHGLASRIPITKFHA